MNSNLCLSVYQVILCYQTLVNHEPFAILSKFCSFSIFSSTDAASASTYLPIKLLLLLLLKPLPLPCIIDFMASEFAASPSPALGAFELLNLPGTFFAGLYTFLMFYILFCPWFLAFSLRPLLELLKPWPLPLSD